MQRVIDDGTTRRARSRRARERAGESLSRTILGAMDADTDMSTLTKRLAGPSTAKAGMETVDQARVNDIIYKASEVDLPPLRARLLWSTADARQGSKFFENERRKDMELTKKIDDMLRRLKAIEGTDLSYERRKADEKVLANPLT